MAPNWAFHSQRNLCIFIDGQTVRTSFIITKWNFHSARAPPRVYLCEYSPVLYLNCIAFALHWMVAQLGRRKVFQLEIRKLMRVFNIVMLRWTTDAIREKNPEHCSPHSFIWVRAEHGAWMAFMWRLWTRKNRMECFFSIAFCWLLNWRWVQYCLMIMKWGVLFVDKKNLFHFNWCHCLVARLFRIERCFE